MSVKKLLDPRNLPYAGAVVQGVLFAIAGNEFFPILGWLAGLGVGMVVNYSIALASSRISDISEKRKPLARLALATMFILSPVTITLSMFYPASLYTAISWSVCVDLSIVLAGAIAGKSLLPAEAPQKPVEPRRAKPKVRSADYTCRNADAGCERKFASQNSANAHARSCKYRKITIDESLLIKK